MALLRDDDAVEALEADFRQFYSGLDLRDLWRPGSGMNYRVVISLWKRLPQDARIWEALVGERARWTEEKHLLADIRDFCMRTMYFSSIAAAKDLNQTALGQINDHAPKPPRRPGDPEPTQKTALTGAELKGTFLGKMVGNPRR